MKPHYRLQQPDQKRYEPGWYYVTVLPERGWAPRHEYHMAVAGWSFGEAVRMLTLLATQPALNAEEEQPN